MNTLDCSANRFNALCYSRYFPPAVNDPDVSHIHRITSALNNKVDRCR